MTEKVKLTREQAAAIETWLMHGSGDIASLLDIHANRVGAEGRGWNNDTYKPFNGLSMADMARALLIGYEVEESLKVGDWAKFIDRWNNNPHYGKIKEIQDGKAWAHWNGKETLGFIHLKDLLPMTPEEIKAEQERRVWAKIGREVGEFYEEDIGIDKAGNIRDGKVDLEHYYGIGRLKGFYPAESFISFGGGEDA